MEKLAVQIFLCLALISLFITSAFCDLSISVEPQGPVKPGTHVRVICNVSKNYQDSPVTWLRKTKSVEFQIAKQQSLESTLYKSGRYILDTGGTNTGVIHILEIKPVEFEDIAEIGCTLEQSTKNPPEYVPLIVCSNPDSDWCKCVVKKKWADPTCGQESNNSEVTNKRLKQGLGACLGIAIVYGFIMTILAGIDCSSRLHKKRLRAQQKAAAQAARNKNPYGDSEQLTLDTSDQEQAMNTSQDMHTASDPMRYPELSTQENGHVRTPVKADVHNYSRDERTAASPPAYPEVYPRDRYQEAANALSNDYTDYRNSPNNNYDQGQQPRQPMEPLQSISHGLDHRAQLPRNDDYNTPGKLSTHSADYMPQYNNQNNANRPSYVHNRGAYSEQKPRQYDQQGHPHNVEPRRLEFAHMKAAEAREPSGPYISPDTCV